MDIRYSFSYPVSLDLDIGEFELQPHSHFAAGPSSGQTFQSFRYRSRLQSSCGIVYALWYQNHFAFSPLSSVLGWLFLLWYICMFLPFDICASRSCATNLGSYLVLELFHQSLFFRLYIHSSKTFKTTIFVIISCNVSNEVSFFKIGLFRLVSTSRCRHVGGVQRVVIGTCADTLIPHLTLSSLLLNLHLH